MSRCDLDLWPLDSPQEVADPLPQKVLQNLFGVDSNPPNNPRFHFLAKPAYLCTTIRRLRLYRDHSTKLATSMPAIVARSVIAIRNSDPQWKSDKYSPDQHAKFQEDRYMCGWVVDDWAKLLRRFLSEPPKRHRCSEKGVDRSAPNLVETLSDHRCTSS